MSRATQDTAAKSAKYTYGTVILYGNAFQRLPLMTDPDLRSPTTPTLHKKYNAGLGWSPFARHY